jgi:hypothetical protein
MDVAHLPAGPDIDALVAETVMGWKRDEPWGPKAMLEAFGKIIGKPMLGPWKVGPGPLDARFDEHWKPSTNIAHAFEVVEHLRAQGVKWEIADDYLDEGLGSWFAMIESGGRGLSPHRTIGPYADTVPLAICRVALLAKEGG